MAKGNYGVTSLGSTGGNSSVGSGAGGSGFGGDEIGEVVVFKKEDGVGSGNRIGANGKPLRRHKMPIIDVKDTREVAALTDEQIDSINKYALKEIQDETGMSKAESIKAQEALLDYLGGDYKGYRTKAEKRQNIETIDHCLSKMQAYDGIIYRGLHFTERQYNKFMADLQAKGYYDGKGSIVSWSSDIATSSAFSGSVIMNKYSVLLVCENNNAAVGVQHITKYGRVEAEVLAPSGVRWRVDNITREGKFTEIHVSQEVFDYKKKK